VLLFFPFRTPAPLALLFLLKDVRIDPDTITGTSIAKLSPVMKNILLCSSNPLLIKNIYGVLRDAGHTVETVEHPALAVKKVLWANYDFVIVDSEPFGMSAHDAAQVIRSVSPGVPIMIMGGEWEKDHGSDVRTPLDLEEFKRTIHSIAV
jgi:CheY-like chemotaxis protein